MQSRVNGIALCALACVLLEGCVSNRPAPVADRAPGSRASVSAPTSPTAKPATRSPDATRPDTYTVKPGDTLFSIALEQGLDYRELAIWNGLDNPGALRTGMSLRLTPPAGVAVSAPLKSPAGSVEARPLASGPASSVPLPATASGSVVLSEPKAVRLPYSEQALAQLSKSQVATPPARAEAPRAEIKPDPKVDSAGEARAPDEIDWAWPVKGKVIGVFNDTTSKGIAIAGKLGQSVHAAAPGRVIFSGTGIRGFGKLIVIKHNETYLSVYGHNSELTVKEGQTIAKGQKIAEMGNTDADQRENECAGQNPLHIVHAALGPPEAQVALQVGAASNDVIDGNRKA
ncbi:MAG: peptidoglycan DD-metalloendopeptidase family protein, partial [Pseudomonadota bacterium]